jgi:hypothetical protein
LHVGWIFQISGTLTQAANTRIHLIGGAVASNIVWVVASAVTIGPGAIFQGDIFAQTDVTFQTGSIDHGCIYAQTAVALQKATVSCGAGGGGPTDPTDPTDPPPTPPTCHPASGTPCFTTTFTGLTGSVHGDDYMTFLLVDTVEG